LAGIARNLCLQRLRRRRELPLDMAAAAGRPASDDGPEEILDRHALSDWVWSALGGLSEPLRNVVVLRHFSHASSYQDVAAALGIPVGTVRSRLSEARRKLADELMHQAARSHGDHAALDGARRSFFRDVCDEYNRGSGCTVLLSALSPTAQLRTSAVAEVDRGPKAIARGLQSDLDAGVRLRVLNVIAGEGITIVEGAFDNPSNDPTHCPPITTQVFVHQDAYIRAIHLHYAAPAEDVGARRSS
jgi:RNA polymerase sigma-70 factor (ECF subfamily)